MTRDSTEWHERSLAHILGVYFGLAFLVLIGCWVMARVFQIEVNRVFLVVGGTLLLGASWLRPWWFWEHPKAQLLRKILGDTGTALVYTLVGIGMLYLGFFTTYRVLR
jgi:hypothetical protein